MPVYAFDVSEKYVTYAYTKFYITADNVEEASEQAIVYVKEGNHWDDMERLDDDVENTTLSLLDGNGAIDKYILQ